MIEKYKTSCSSLATTETDKESEDMEVESAAQHLSEESDEESLYDSDEKPLITVKKRPQGKQLKAIFTDDEPLSKRQAILKIKDNFTQVGKATDGGPSKRQIACWPEPSLTHTHARAPAYPVVTTRHYVHYGLFGPHYEEEDLVPPDQLLDPLPPPNWVGFTVMQRRTMLKVVGTLKHCLTKAKYHLMASTGSNVHLCTTDGHVPVNKGTAEGPNRRRIEDLPKSTSACEPAPVYPIPTTSHFVPFGLLGPHYETEDFVCPDKLLDPLPPPDWGGYTVEEQRQVLRVVGTLKHFLTKAKCMMIDDLGPDAYYRPADAHSPPPVHLPTIPK